MDRTGHRLYSENEGSCSRREEGACGGGVEKGDAPFGALAERRFKGDGKKHVPRKLAVMELVNVCEKASPLLTFVGAASRIGREGCNYTKI